MKIKALTNFAGPVSMYEGQVRICEKTATITALINDGYVEVIEEGQEGKSENAPEPEEKDENPKAGKKK